jgi:hypothetical protein
MKHLITYLLLLLLWSVGCQKDKSIAPTANRIRFDDMQVGQKSRYVYFLGGIQGQMGSAESFQYVSDTLEVEVMESNGNTFTLRESLTPGSLSILYPDSIGSHGGNAPNVFQVKIHNDSLSFPPQPSQGLFRSHLFMNFGLPLRLNNIQEPKNEMEYWYPKNIYTGSYIEDYEQLSTDYARLNLAMDYSAVVVDGDGYYLLYASDSGIVRSGFRGSWAPRGGGWDLLPE